MGLDSERILFELSYPRVYRAVYVYCRSHQLAEDAVQEAFLIAFQKAAKLREKSKFVPWVTTIAINIIKTDYYKNNKAQLYASETGT